MSVFNRFCAKARSVAGKVTDKAEKLVDSAAKSVKIKALEIRIDEQYESLGKLIYRDLHIDEDLEDEKLALVAAIDALYDELALLKEEPDGDEDEGDVEADAEQDDEQEPLSE